MITTFLKRAGLLFTLVTCTVLSANAIIYPINITLTGLQEVPPNASTGTGTLVGTYNDSSNVLKYTVTFSGLSANVTAAHFHAPAFPGINAGITYGPAGFPTGVMSGNFVDSVVLRPGQEDTLMRGLWYFNIHTSTYPGGELRGQVFLQKKTSFVVPVIECPSDTAVDNDPGLCSASVALTAVDTTAVGWCPALAGFFYGTNLNP